MQYSLKAILVVLLLSFFGCSDSPPTAETCVILAPTQVGGPRLGFANFQSDVAVFTPITQGLKAVLGSPAGILVEVEAVRMPIGDVAVFEVTLKCNVQVSFMLDDWEDVTVKVNDKLQDIPVVLTPGSYDLVIEGHPSYQ